MPRRYKLGPEGEMRRVWNGRLPEEFDQRDVLAFMAETDLKLQGKVSADTLSAIRGAGYDYQGGAVKMRTEAVLQEAAIPIEVSVRPIEPQGKLIGFASVNFGGVVVDDFKVVNGQNGVFLGAPSKPDPTSRTGYRSTVRINDRGTQERLNAAGAQAYQAAVEKLLARAEAVRWAVKPSGAVLFFAQCPYDKILGASNLSMLRYEWVWYKSRCTGFLNARRAPLKKTENILVFYQKLPLYNPQFEQGRPYKKTVSRSGQSPNYGKFTRSGGGSEDGRRFPGNLLSFQTVAHTVHPTQKPVELCEYLIKTYTSPGQVVADICAGSGTTAIAALNTGREFICFETAPAFYGPATERITQAQAAVAVGGKGL